MGSGSSSSSSPAASEYKFLSLSYLDGFVCWLQKNDCPQCRTRQRFHRSTVPRHQNISFLVCRIWMPWCVGSKKRLSSMQDSTTISPIDRPAASEYKFLSLSHLDGFVCWLPQNGCPQCRT